MQRLARLNVSPQIVGKLDMNPVTRPEIILYGETYKLGPPLDEDELNIFKAQFAVLLAAPSSSERRLMLDRLDVYVMGLRAIKHVLKDVKFTGINPEDAEIGFGLLRPQFFRTTGAYKTTWAITMAAATWTDWLFDVANTPMISGKDFGMVISHLKSFTAPDPFTSEVKFQIGRRGILIPNDVRGLRLSDTENNVAIVPVPSMIVAPSTSFYARAKSDVGGTDELAVGGIVVGLGKALKEETATWTS